MILRCFNVKYVLFSLIGMCETKHTDIKAKSSLGMHYTMIPPERTFAVGNCLMLYDSTPLDEELGVHSDVAFPAAP